MYSGIANAEQGKGYFDLNHRSEVVRLCLAAERVPTQLAATGSDHLLPLELRAASSVIA
ncbi:hypothetical protein GCM10023264_11880 [Sphingomonas daechungensis]